MSGQDRYDGPKKHGKNLATMSDIWALQQQLSSNSSDYICFPSDDGIPISPVGEQKEFIIQHPAMDCVQIAIYDKSCNRWASTDVEVIDNENVKLTFRNTPEADRLCVFVRGKLVTN